MALFWKGIIVGFGGVSPGLSGSVLLIIFGLYQQTLDALGTLFRDFRRKIRFLLPLVTGMCLGVLIFGKVIDFFLGNFEMLTRFCFLGLILGTLPMVYNEVRKEGFSPKYYLVMLVSAVLGIWVFTVDPDAFSQITEPNLLRSVLLGVAVAASAIIPGVEPAVLLSTLGFYEMYISALADVNLQILLPMLIGVAFGAVGIAYTMSWLFRRMYTASFSVIFGIFLAMIPNMLNESCVLGWNAQSALSLSLTLIGFAVSYYLGDLETNNRRIKRLFRRV